MDVCALFAGVTIVLVVWVAVGHGLWVFTAAILRAFREPPRRRERCPACARLLDFEARCCGVCGFQLDPPQRPSLAGDLQAVERQLARLAQAGRISDATATTFRDALSNDRAEREAPSLAKIAGESPVDPAEPQPAPRPAPLVAAILSSAGPPTPTASLLAAHDGVAAPATPAATTASTTAASGAMSGAASGAGAIESRSIPSFAETVDLLSANASGPSEKNPARGLAGILQSFMEEKNIRWAELVSALLIVGSSIGLVISLWATLKQAIPYFPVVVFLAATGGLHGAGLYTLRRWRLKSTSRGLLLVSTLLVPLNVLAAIALNDGKPRYEAVDYAAVSVGLMVLGGIVLSAARILNRRYPWPMFLAVMGCAVGMPFIGRLCDPQSTEPRILLLFLLPFASVALAILAHVRWLAAGRRLTPRRAAQSFRLVGIALFSLAIACGLLSWKSQNLVGTLSLLSPFVGLIATSITSAGLVIHRRLALPSQAGYRTAGTSLALGGAILGTAAIFFAWPRPDLLLEVGLINAIALTALGWLAELPLLQVFATASLSLSSVVGFDWAAGRISIPTATSQALSGLLMEAQSALLLTVFGVLADGAGSLLLRTKARRQAGGYFLAGSCQTLAGVVIGALAVINGGADANLATAVFLLTALRWLAAAWWIRRESTSGVAAAFLLAAFLHGFGMNSAVAEFLDARGLRPADPWTTAFLLHATLCAAYAGFSRFLCKEREAGGKGGDKNAERTLVLPFGASALITSALAFPLIVDVGDQRFAAHCGYSFWGASIWFFVAVLYETPFLAALAQLVATVGVVYGVTSHSTAGPSWGDRLLNPHFLNLQLAALALWCTLWVGLRRLAQPSPNFSRVLKPGATTVDRMVLAAVVVELAGTCAHACLPGICAEFGLPGAVNWGEAFLYFLLLVPFGIGAILTAVRSMFPKWWHEATALAIAPIFIGVVLLMEPASALWPGFPTPYGRGWGAGAWAALALTGLAVLAAHWEKPGRATVAGLVSVLTTVPALLACRWDRELATASALRWTSAFAALAAVVVFAWRGPIGRIGRRLDFREASDASGKQWVDFRNAVLSTASFPILVLTIRDLIGLAAGTVSAGPVPGSLFARLGTTASDVGPVAILAAAFLVCAATDRRLDWAIPATFLAQIAFGIFAWHRLEQSPQRGGPADFVFYFQEMGISAGLAAAAWLMIEPFWNPPVGSESHHADDASLTHAAMLRTQLILVAMLASVLTLGATVGLMVSPAPLPELVEACGKPLGWLFFSLAAVVWCVARRSRWPDSALDIGALYAMAAAPLAAAALAPFNRPDNWLSFHAAMSGWGGLIALATLAAAAATWVNASSRGWQGTGLAEGAAQPELVPTPGFSRLSVKASRALRVADLTLRSTPVIVLFALIGEWSDPLRPTWSAESMLRLAVCTTILAVCAESYGRAYLSLVLVILGSIFLGLRPWVVAGAVARNRAPENLIDVTVFGAAVYGLIWLAIGIVWERRLKRRFNLGSATAPPDQVVAFGGTFFLGVITLSTLLYHVLPNWPVTRTSAYPLEWASLVLLALVAFGSLWKRGARHPFPLLYALGLISLATYLDRLNLSRPHFLFGCAAAAAGYLVLVGVIWRARRPLRALGLRLGMCTYATAEERVRSWLPLTNVCIASLAIAVEFWVVLTFESPSLRIGGALSTLALAVSFALLATLPRRDVFHAFCLGIGAIAAVQFGWALMNPAAVPHETLRRTIWLMVMLVTTTITYGVVLVRLAPLESAWRISIRRAAVVLAGISIAALGLVLALELQSFDPAAGAPLSMGETLLVSAALIGLAGTLILFATVPNRDPFLLTERQRFLYVYAAEAVAGLLIAHLYLTEPELFRHTLQPYWPLIVMAIAFCGTGVSELFRRRRVGVLAKPLEYTAAFLPLLPAAGFWLLSSRLDYSTTLMLVGLLYLLLTLMRGSFVYSTAAAIAGNATLFALFHEHGVSLFAHPQMFVIPPCLTVLAAAQINRDRLGEGALSSVRYFALTTIYVSSTGEMFQTGIGESLWLPMVLAGLSVSGVMAGIMLRVRAFLYLGTAFLVLSMVSMVWHAARSIGHVWPWWAFLFALGLALLTLFGVFEKKRPEMLLLIDRMRQWER